MRQISVAHGQRGPRLLLVSCCFLLLLLAGAGIVSPRAAAAGRHVDVMTLQDEVSPASLRFLSSAIDRAQSDGAQALIIQLDTPGGDLDSMNAMVQKELAATVPVVVYVSPSGAQAASAGSFVAMAAHINVMAPTTRIGAASPVDMNGGDIPSTLKAKITNDLVAEMNGLCQRYDRNAQLADRMIINAAAYNEQEAVSGHLVDLEAQTLQDLLNKIDGRQVKLDSGQVVTLNTVGATEQTIDKSLSDSLFGFLLNPNIAFILLVLAGIGIYLEISHPGAIVPGVVGAIALVLFLLTAGSLSPNWAGLALVVISFVLLILDVRLPSHGVLTAGALISLVLGSLLFFDNPSNLGAPVLSLWVLCVMVLVVAAIAVTVLVGVVHSRRLPVNTGKEGMMGQMAQVTVTLAPSGRVKLFGEDWAARNVVVPEVPVEVGQKVRVVGIEGLTLLVEPEDPLLSQQMQDLRLQGPPGSPAPKS